MQHFLREWRQDAFNKHQYESAVFIGDKLLALTSDPTDAFWLAQVHFSMGHYNRAYGFLLRQDLISKSLSCKYLAGMCLIRQSKFEQAMEVIGEKNPTHLASQFSLANGKRKLQHDDGSKDSRARKRADDKSVDDESNDRKYDAALCYLRGLIYAKQNSFDLAKESYKCAVRIDITCFEAFDQLMKNSLMSPNEEWDFLESLGLGPDDSSSTTAFTSVPSDTLDFIKALYTTRLSKYKNTGVLATAITKLAEPPYNLGNNADLILSRAELLFTQCKFKECFELCETIVAKDRYNFSAYPLYLACMHELNERNKLFLVSHDLADNHPDEPVTWLAVGVYYLTIGKISEARRYFSKASMMDPHFGPAWIGFAHTFAAEAEHDQAISAYATAARLFQGTHLPQLFLGMQHLQLSNITLADEYLSTARTLCSTDPLLLNEQGVVFYHRDHLDESVKLFQSALQIADEIGSDPKAWVATRANLGHALRRMGRLEDAREEFEAVKRMSAADSGVYSALGLVNMQAGQPWEAILNLHEALAINPQDPIATDLIERALKENAESKFNSRGFDGNPFSADKVDIDIDGRLNHMLYRRPRMLIRQQSERRNNSERGRISRHSLQEITHDFVSESDDESMMEASDG